jgi:hypothetical protein
VFCFRHLVAVAAGTLPHSQSNERFKADLITLFSKMKCQQVRLHRRCLYNPENLRNTSISSTLWHLDALPVYTVRLPHSTPWQSG